MSSDPLPGVGVGAFLDAVEDDALDGVVLDAVREVLDRCDADTDGVNPDGFYLFAVAGVLHAWLVRRGEGGLPVE